MSPEPNVLREDEDWHSWPQGAMQALMEARAQEVSEDLIGTCQSLSIFADEEEIDDPAFARELRFLCFCCEVCDWWSSTDDEAYADICTECAEEGHGL